MGLCVRLLVAYLVLVWGVPSYALDVHAIKRWGEDLDAFAQGIEAHHIDPFHALSKNDFNQHLTAIKSMLGESSENEIIVELMRLTHSIGDGHTSLPLWQWPLHQFPVGFKVLAGELYCVQATPKYSHLLGARLKSINGVSAGEVMAHLAELTPFTENRYSEAVRVAEYLVKAEILHGLGITEQVTRAAFEFELEGRTAIHHLVATQSPARTSALTLLPTKGFSRIEDVSEDLWFSTSKNKKTLYVKFRRYTSMAKMERFADDLLRFIRRNEARNLIIDLRDNYGGDFFVGLKLAQRLVLADSINWRSGVYVLTDNVTFSAAMSNAAQFSQLLNATRVGEPTGARPSGYQDMGQFELTHSKLQVTYSKRLYHFNRSGQDALYPDVPITLTIEDFRKGFDRSLDWILRDIADRESSSSTR